MLIFAVYDGRGPVGQSQCMPVGYLYDIYTRFRPRNLYRENGPIVFRERVFRQENYRMTEIDLIPFSGTDSGLNLLVRSKCTL